jgi:hypothetical protein
MAKKSKLNLINDDLTWNADRRYKVNSVVQLNGEDYQNITGKNSNPELLIDWQKIYTDIAISDVTGLPMALDALQLNKEDKTNKQNSLDTDVTGTKYPTVNAVKNAIDGIYQPDTVIRYTAPTRVGNTFTFPSGGYDVLLSKQFHTNVSELETTIAAATDGFKRIDLIYYKADDTIAKIQGTESATVAVIPDVPAGCIQLCPINVFGSTIEVPEVNGAYVQKSERANVVLTGSGVINQLDLVDEKATIVFKGTVTILNTITYNSVPYNGKRITLFNAQNTPVTIGNSVSGYGVDFVFPDGQDYVLQPNQTIEFSFDITYAPYAHHMFIGDRNTIAKDDLAYYDLSLNYGGGNGPETLNTNKSNIRIVADISGGGGIEGFIFGAGYQPYDGKIFTITNNLLFPVELSPPFFKSVEKFLDSGLTMAFIYDNNSGNPIFRQLSAIEPVDRQIQVGSGNSVIPASFNKKTILFSANATITVPSTLPDEFSFVFRTLAGVTVTWAITAPFTWETTPSTTPEKTTGSFMRRGSTNTILLDF